MLHNKRYLGIVLVVLLLVIPFCYAVDSFEDDSFTQRVKKGLWNVFYHVYSSLTDSTITGFAVSDGTLVGTLDFSEPDESEQEPEPTIEPVENTTEPQTQPDTELSELIDATTELIENADPPSEVTDEGAELVEKLQEKIEELSDESNLPNLSGTSGEVESNTTNSTQDSSSASPEVSLPDESSSGTDTNSSEDQSNEEEEVPLLPEVEEDTNDNSTGNQTVDVEEESPQEEPTEESSEEEQPDDEPQEEPTEEEQTQEVNEEESDEPSEEEQLEPVEESVEEPTNDPTEEEPTNEEDPGEETQEEQETEPQEPIPEPFEEESVEPEEEEQPAQEEQPVQQNENDRPFMQLISDYKVGSDVTININPEGAATTIVVTYDEVAYDVTDNTYSIPAEGEYIVNALVEVNGVTTFLEETFSTQARDPQDNPTFIENILDAPEPEAVAEPEYIDFARSFTNTNYVLKWEAEVEGPKKIIIPHDAFNIVVAKKENGLAQLSGQTIYKPYDASVQVNGIEQPVSDHNEQKSDEFEERKQEFEENGGSDITGFVVNQRSTKAGLIPRMLDALYNWLFSGGITGNVVATGDAPDTVLEIDEGTYSITYETIEYVVDPSELDETYTCDFGEGNSISIVENMACYGLDVRLSELIVAPSKSVVFKNSNVIVGSAVLDGTLHLEGELAHFIVNEDMQVNSGGKLVMNHSNLVLNATESVNPTFNLVPGAKMVVTKNSKITNGIEYGGTDDTFQFIVNAREYRLR